jgi:hypothetical protein
MKKTATKKGVDWDGHVLMMSSIKEVIWVIIAMLFELLDTIHCIYIYSMYQLHSCMILLFFTNPAFLLIQLETIKAELEQKDIVYPDYYLKPFHAYDEGNLSWMAAFEVEPASYAVALRAFGKIDPSLSPTAAFERCVWG